MKKLMIAAAIVCAATMAQAYAVNWYTSSGTICDGYNNDGEGYSQAAQPGTIYIFNKNVSGVTQQALIEAVFGVGDMTTIASMDSYVSANGQMKSSAKKELEADYNNFAPVRAGESGNYADYFYAMLIKETDGTKHLFVTDTYSTLINTSKDTSLQQSLTAVSVLNKGETSTFAGSGWYTQAVPEPTSGLLLLLGVAGLALRRRRD